MTTENLDGGGSFSAAEDAYFASGGEGTIPEEGAASGSAPAAGAGDGGAAAAPVEGAAPGAAVAPKAGDTIPLARFLEEKKSRKAMETQLAELRGKFSVIERLGLPGGESPPWPIKEDGQKTPPTAEEDIFGNVKHVGETVEQLKKRLDDADATAKAQGEQTAFVNNYRADADKFKATTPDFMDGYYFILNSRAQELMSIGYDNPADPTLTPDEKQAAAKALHEALVADEYAIAEIAFKKGKSPSEMLYALAKQRGYKAAAAPGAVVDTGKGAEMLDRIERGQAAHKSLSTPGGATGDAGMTAERLISMDMPDFEAWCENNKAAAKRILGG